MSYIYQENLKYMYNNALGFYSEKNTVVPNIIHVLWYSNGIDTYLVVRCDVM